MELAQEVVFHTPLRAAIARPLLPGQVRGPDAAAVADGEKNSESSDVYYMRLFL